MIRREYESLIQTVVITLLVAWALFAIYRSIFDCTCEPKTVTKNSLSERSVAR